MYQHTYTLYKCAMTGFNGLFPEDFNRNKKLLNVAWWEIMAFCGEQIMVRPCKFFVSATREQVFLIVGPIIREAGAARDHVFIA